MRVRFLLGPAGSGKTFRCLTEVRQALSASPQGPPLLLVSPKQTTYQLERQLLADPSLPGYTRLNILSFERLAHFVFEGLGLVAPQMLDDEGRVMVLRALLARKRGELKLFSASARLTGFALQLSLLLSDLQRSQQTPETLRQLAAQFQENKGLAGKLEDLATVLEEYLAWLTTHNLQDGDCLLSAASLALRQGDESPESEVQPVRRRLGEGGRPKSDKVGSELSEVRGSKPSGCSGPPATDYGALTTDSSALRIPRSAFRIQNLWVDGFAELSAQEADLLAALAPHCEEATVTFCLDELPKTKLSWLSSWSVARKSFEECKKGLAGVPGVELEVEVIKRQPEAGRFQTNPVLAHLEKHWETPEKYADDSSAAADVAKSLRVAACPNPEAEAVLAAREILRHVRSGGRYREITVLVRALESYYEPLQRIFSRYEIPYFLDRRESVAHHPLAELTRSALRTVASQWMREDWFAALKTGLVPSGEIEIDRLENEALARGWKGAIWQKPILIHNDAQLTGWLADLHHRILPPFQRLALALELQQNKPTGPQLADALRDFWKTLSIEEQLFEWAAAEVSSAELRLPNAVHATVWEQMKVWLSNLELAFANESLPLREWLPILDAGLSNLTVGLIPPALDQVFVGAIDRSRNPQIELALVLGLNEGVFPAPPSGALLLTDADRLELERRNITLGAGARQQLARERYYAYIACTRARQRVVLTSAHHDANGAPLNPSPFLAQVLQLFPSLKPELAPKSTDWTESEHPSELIGPLLSTGHSALRTPHSALLELPVFASLLASLRHLQTPPADEALSPELAARLYGPVLHTSVSRMEQFAACPFKFFVHSGLRAEERQKFELDIKEQGTFQHEVLALFHQQLHREHKRWRDITPSEARERIDLIARGLLASYREGLLQASEQTRFLARVLTESLQDFAETLVGWMREQYEFEPVEVELPFGEDEASPAWAIQLPNGPRLELYGRIDRVDLHRDPSQDEALCVVVDYKSSQKQLDPVLLANGLQLQLLTYLNVLRRWPDPRRLFGVSRLVPAGVFYVNLRGKYGREDNRRDALAGAEQAHKNAYRHTGRFDTRALRLLDARPGATEGDQFSYRLTKSGQFDKRSREALPTSEFETLLDSIETHLRDMGRQIFSGVAKVDPYQKASSVACDQCDYHAICRIDPWTHRYRVLRKADEEQTG